MSENNANTETNKYLFINLITMLSITAMQQLGKIINPALGKADINLEAAQATIDTLDMLSAKTGGQLDNEEARFLKDTLAALKMNYVETKEMQKVDLSSQRHEGRRQNEKPQDTATKEPTAGSEQTKDPKFHKSYD